MIYCSFQLKTNDAKTWLLHMLNSLHCVKSIKIRSFFWSEYGKSGPKKTPYWATFHADLLSINYTKIFSLQTPFKREEKDVSTQVYSIVTSKTSHDGH